MDTVMRECVTTKNSMINFLFVIMNEMDIAWLISFPRLFNTSNTACTCSGDTVPILLLHQLCLTIIYPKGKQPFYINYNYVAYNAYEL